jgi:sugar (pentulose or hexulose) kinase
MQGAHMQGADVLIAVDVGTSGARASGFDVSGAPLDEVRRPYPTYLPAEGWAEQDARRWQSAALSALGALVRSLGPRARVRAVAVTGQCPSVVPLDRRDLPLGPGIIYRDNRATAEADWMREKFGDRELHELTGHVPAAFHVAAKIAWLRAHQPGVFAATRRFVQPTDYVALGLTGQATTDWSMAAATALLDLRARRWAPELLAALGLDAAMLPAVVPSWSVAGEIRPKLARRLGLQAGVPVVAGGAVTGLSLRHDRGAVARAALEGIACGVRARLEVLGRTSAPATELRVSGGGAGLAVWNQIKADVTGIPVVRVAGDSTAAGAAMLAGLGAGVYRDAAEAVSAGYRPLGRAEPDPDHRTLYDDLYERYQALLGSRVVR